jgi:hypothetical protein
MMNMTRKSGTRRRVGWMVCAWLGVLLALSLAACASTPQVAAPAGGLNPAEASAPATSAGAGEPAPANTGAAGASGAESTSEALASSQTDAPEPQAEATPESAEVIQAKWQASTHAQTYVLGSDGKNATCAQCHAPVQWVPSMDEMPESCYACKFEIDPPPPVIAEADWTHVECKICHQTKKKEVLPEIGWLEIAQIEQYAVVSSATELCLKCHRTVEVVGHVDQVRQGAHVEMGCTDCHDAHSQTASCAEAGCHETMDARAVIAGHDADHAMVTCSACHDASGLEVGPDAAGNWVTFHPQPADPAEQVAFTSHNTVLEAPCERCHFADNPWGLSLVEQPAP